MSSFRPKILEYRICTSLGIRCALDPMGFSASQGGEGYTQVFEAGNLFDLVAVDVPVSYTHLTLPTTDVV